LLIALDSAVSAGISATVFHSFRRGLTVNERPEELRERDVECEHDPCIADHGLDLAAMADDPRIAHQAFDVTLAEPRDRLDVPAVEGLSIPLALVQDRRPREAGLSALEVESSKSLRSSRSGTPHSSSW
jgi:hypothetical protein